ncbi:FAD-dependent oxidoreductase [Streptosporangium sandarakinum]|uniref:FAD-dependent oxidoreductase n=1 Tax=Streptosporangium sandarakinum TaxID=1260955 RepID=UPI003448F062
MKHRIVVLGAGYAGAYVAGNLARRLSPADTEITVINAEPDFVERLRLHQLAAGREIGTRRLADVFAGTGIRLRVARVTAVDPEHRVVAVTDAGGGDQIGYDTLLYALGSHGDDRAVPGAAEHAFDIAARPSALRLRERLDGLGGPVGLGGRGEGGHPQDVAVGHLAPDLRHARAQAPPGRRAGRVRREGGRVTAWEPFLRSSGRAPGLRNGS